jgi:hypothetical protein
MSDRAALVTALTVDRPMCEECIVVKSGLGLRDLRTTLAVIGEALRIHDSVRRCWTCDETKGVLSLDRPAR